MNRIIFLVCLLIGCTPCACLCVPQVMTYQGRLTNELGRPLSDGTCAMQFRLYDVATDGKPLWQEPALDPMKVQVTGGVFSVVLGSVIPLPPDVFEKSLWLETVIEGKTLAPRVQLTSAAYAMRAQAAESVVAGSVGAGDIASGQVVKSINGLTDAITLTAGNNIIIGQKGNNFNITSPSWGLNGNSGTTSSHFVGTIDDQPLVFKAGGAQALRLEGGQLSCPNIVAGHSANSVGAGVFGAVIGGGGSLDYPNKVFSCSSTIGGGVGNTAGDGAWSAYHNTNSTVSGGCYNTASGYYTTVGGGNGNEATDTAAVVGGGLNNTSSRMYSTVAGGVANEASGSCSAVLGGDTNAATYLYSSVTGGRENTASGWASIVAGGYGNTAAAGFSFAAGSNAQALHTGTFVWADKGDGLTTNLPSPFESTAANQFLIRARGGVGIGTNAPQSALSVNAGINLDQDNLNNGTLSPGLVFGSGSGEGISSKRTSGGNQYGLDFYTNFTPRMSISPAGNVGIGSSGSAYKLHVNGSVAGVGGYISLSDARLKTNVTSIGGALEKVMDLRGVTFDWKADEHKDIDFRSGRQIGFIAQEIEETLPEVVVKDDQGVRSVDYSAVVPVLVEAIKEQQKMIDRLEAKIEELEKSAPAE